MSQPLVLGYDGSDASRAALEEVLRLADDVGADVIAVFGYAPSRVGAEVADYAQALREAGQETLGHAVHQAQAAGKEITAELVDQRPAEALVAVADKYDARAIVVGTTGVTGLRGAILGSQAYRLLAMSQRPILLVPV
jgi:nucleotide-binding universal stress UspA family protein